MIAIGLWGLDRGSWWNDESVTLDVASRTPAQILQLVRHVDAVHATYYGLMHLWVHLGSGEVWLRLPSVAAMGAAVALVAHLGAVLATPRTGLVAGLVLALLPGISFYAQEARPYALVTAAVLAATACLLAGVRRPSTRRWAAYAALLVLAGALNLMALLVVAAHAVTLVWWRAPLRTVVGWAASTAVAAGCLLPLAVVAHRQSGQVAWVPTPDWRTLPDWLGHLVGPSVGATVVIAVLAAGALTGSSASRAPHLMAVAVPLLVVPPVALLVISLTTSPLFVDRYVLYAAAGLALLVGSGVDRLAGLAG